MKRAGGVVVVLLVGVLVLVACGRRGGAPTGQATPAPGATAPGATPGGGATVTVEEKEFAFSPAPITVPAAGPVTFTIENKGSVEHNFLVCQGPPQAGQSGCPQGTYVDLEAIPPGRRETVTATIPAGTYKVVCTVPGHEEAGMATTLRVGQ